MSRNNNYTHIYNISNSCGFVSLPIFFPEPNIVSQYRLVLGSMSDSVFTDFLNLFLTQQDF
jgi:hypothetical protein